MERGNYNHHGKNTTVTFKLPRKFKKNLKTNLRKNLNLNNRDLKSNWKLYNNHHVTNVMNNFLNSKF